MAQHIPIKAVKGKRYREIEQSILNNPPSRGSLKWQLVEVYYDDKLQSDIERYIRVRPVKVNKLDFGLDYIYVEVYMKKNKQYQPTKNNIKGMYFVA